MKKIVLIENDEQFGSSIKAHLSKLGYDVELVNRPCAVANTLRTFKPDMVLADRLMPGTDGRNLPFTLKQLCQDRPGFKLVLFSSSCKEAQAELIDSELVDGCIERGVSPELLDESIKALLGDCQNGSC